MERKYYLKVNGQEVEVSQEVYKVYYQGKNKEEDFVKSDIRNKVSYYSALDTEDMNGEDIFADTISLNIEQAFIHKQQIEKLNKAIEHLTEKEKECIKALYDMKKSERQYAKELEVNYSVVNKRHQRVLQKLKLHFEKNLKNF